MKTNKQPRVYLNTEDLATAYLEGLGLGLVIQDGKVQGFCSRCGGCGSYSFNYRDGSVCYGCRGTGGEHWEDVIPFAKKTRARELRRIHAHKVAEAKAKIFMEKKLEGQRNWCEKNGHGRITFEELDAKRTQEREAKEIKDAEGLIHLGTIGKRMTFEDMTFSRMSKTWESEGFYTTTTMAAFTFTDPQGNEVVWITKSCAMEERGCKAGDSITFKGTVKDHKEYRSKPQTIINRLHCENVREEVV